MPQAADSTVTVFEAIHSLRALREYKPDPIPEEALDKILRAGTMACSSGNTQPWEFLVLTDKKLKDQVGEWMAETFPSVDAKRAQTAAQLQDGVGRSITGHASVKNICNVPAIIIVFWNPHTGIREKNQYSKNPDGTMVENKPTQGRGSSLFPACQNMMLAARALGIGSLFATFLKIRADDIKRLLHVPPEMFLETCVFLGYPNEKLGPPRRKPIEQVAHRDLWENTYKPVTEPPARDAYKTISL